MTAQSEARRITTVLSVMAACGLFYDRSTAGNVSLPVSTTLLPSLVTATIFKRSNPADFVAEHNLKNLFQSRLIH
jgi:hypothetical protein